MKKDVAEYVARCLVCQQVKAEQKKPGGLLHPLEVPQWKWGSVSMDFIDGLPRSRKGNTGIWEVVEPSLLREVEVERDATIRRAPTRILGSEIRKLRNREVRLVKVQWGEDESNATWETEAKMRSLYPFLFEGMSFNFFFIICLVLILSLVCPLVSAFDL